MKLFNRLKRVTNSNSFIPEIDGLRFIAIASVILCHFNVFFLLKNPGGYTTQTSDHGWLNFVTENGNYGVHLFFAISGFILFLPFAKHHLRNEKKPVLGDYYIRRLTRIEPPYFIVMVGLFILWLITHKLTFEKNLPNLLASLTYTHNLFYGKDVLPVINTVAWSLEVEVQFYLLAPFMASLFTLGKSQRRTIVVLASVAMVFLQTLYTPPFLSLYNYLQFFLIGFLLADLFITGDRLFPKPNVVATVVLGLLFFGMIWVFRPEAEASFALRMGWSVLLPTLILSFYYLVLFTPFWKALFSNRLLSTIGGMCYSIYLLHNPIIWGYGKLPFSRKFTDLYLADWAINLSILVLIILSISTAFYMLVEKPCMNRYWMSDLKSQIAAFFRRDAKQSESN